MKRSWLTFATVLVAVAAGTFGGTRLLYARSAPPSMAQLRDAAWLQRSLGLSAEQSAAVAKLQGGLRSDLEGCCAQHCAARAELGVIIFDESKSPDDIAPVVERMCKAQLRSDLATVEHIRKVRALLTPEQRTRYEKMVSGCVCADCPHGFEHGK
jgi:hypothetical protein